MNSPIDANSTGSDTESISPSSRKLWQLACAGGVLVLLVIVLYPGTLANPAVSSLDTNQPVNTSLTPQQQDVCNSAHDEIAAEIPADQNHDAAADLVGGMYCSRPDLVDNIGSTAYPATGLLAYACDTTSGTVNDTDASQTLQQFGSLYCSGAKTSLNSEIADLQASVGALNGNVKYSNTLYSVSTDLAQAQSLVQNGKLYGAYQEFNAASKTLADIQT